MKIFEYVLNLRKKIVPIDAIGVVKEPAIESNFVKLAKETNELKFAVNKKQHVITGPVLIPNKKIYRSAESLGLNEDGYIFFSAETIKKMAELHMENENLNKFSLEHEQSSSDLKVIESWIILDSQKDKAAVLGFNLPAGTWMMSAKVMNKDLWNRTEAGEFNGFSIEASFMDRIEIEMSKDEVDLSEEEMAELIVLNLVDAKLKIEPNEGESEEDFIGRCIPFEIENGYSKEEATAICYSKYKNK